MTGLFKTAAENVSWWGEGMDVGCRRACAEPRECCLSLAPDKQQRTAAVCRLSVMAAIAQN